MTKKKETRRFIGRKEYFGSLVFDMEVGDYIPFDSDATLIFEKSKRASLDNIYKHLEDNLEKKSFDTFIELSKSVGLLDPRGRFTGIFLPNAEADGRLSAPVKVYLSLTRECNLACAYCYNASGVPLPDELKTREVKDLIDQMADMGVFELSLGGGEPLLRKDFFEIVSHANKAGIQVEVSTNATVINSALAESIKDVDIRCLKISVPAASEKTYDAVRGVRSYRKAISGIEAVQSIEAAPFYFYMLLIKDNISEIPGVIKMAERYRADKIVFDEVMPSGRAEQNRSLLFNAEEAIDAYNKIFSFMQMSRVRMETPNRVPPGGKRRIVEGFGCDCGRLIIHIDSTGKVAPSGFLHERLPCGNIRDKMLKEIWESAPALRSLRKLEGEKICLECDFFRSCRGGCRGRTLLTLHDLELPDPFCPVAMEKEKERKVRRA
ncbi:MAG: radical SAM protein [Chloroflexi bacterium]|nr:radical SAM protein [Chloroflexota bacterium]